MALNRVRPLYTPRWQRGMVRAVAGTFDAEVALYRVENGQGEYNPDTDEWERETTTFYTGPARVQPVRVPQVVPASGDTTSLQRVLVSLPLTDTIDELLPGNIVHYVEGTKTMDIYPGLEVKILSAPLLPALENYILYVRDTVNEANAFERTIICDVNQEAPRG